MRTPLSSLVLALVSFASVTAYAQVSLDFETAGQYSGNFRNLSSGGNNTQSSITVANDYLSHDIASSSTNAAALLYDTTPGDTTLGTQSTFSVSSPLKVEFDFRATTATSSVGIIFADPNDASNNILALFNIDNTGTTDLFRFFKDGTVNTSGVTAGTLSGTNQSVSASTGVDVGSTFRHYSVTLSVAGTVPTLAVTVGSQTFSNTLGGLTDYDWGNTTVILRLFDAGGTASSTDIWVDNFTISSVPEPSTYAAIFGVAVLGLALSRRRPRA